MTYNISNRIYSYDKPLTQSQMKIAKIVTEDYDKVAFLSLRDFARYTRVAESTIIRFANLLGYNGYKDFREAIQQLFDIRTPPSKKLEKMQKRIRESDVIEQIISEEIYELENFLDSIHREDLYEITDSIIGAEYIYIVATNTDKPIAEMLYNNLSLLLDNIRFIAIDSIERMYRHMLVLSPSDTVIAISFGRDQESAHEALKFGYLRKATTVAITNSASSYSAEYADYTLSGGASDNFIYSMTLPSCIVNILSMLVARRIEKRASLRLKSLEKLLTKYEKQNSAPRGINTNDK